MTVMSEMTARWRHGCVLAVCALVIFAGRWRLASAPLQADIGAYALIGHEMLAGRPLYVDLWERKPPLLYLTFAAGEELTGYDRGEILLVNLAATLLTLVGVYACGRSAGFGNAGGIFAAVLWTLLCADMGLTANQPDPEAFINTCVTLAAAILLYSTSLPQRRWIRFIGVGALLAAATFYKHNAALLCAMLLLGYIIAHRHTLRQALMDAAMAAAVVAAAWCVLLAHAYFTGSLAATVDVLFRQNVAYSNGSFGHNLATGLLPDRLFPPFMTWAIAPLTLVLIFAGIKLARRTQVDAGGWTIIAAWAVGVWMTIALTGHVYAHYYVLWLPVTCVAAGWAAAGLWASRHVLWRAAVVVSAVCVIVRQAAQFTLPPQQWVRRQFPYYDVAAQNAFALQLGRLLRPDESFYELGEDNTLYFLSCHSPPSGLLFIDPLIYGSDTRSAWKRLMSDFAMRPPDMVVLSSDWLPFFSPDAPVFPWLRANYDPYPTPVGRPTYRLFVRRGGKLERRLNGQ